MDTNKMREQFEAWWEDNKHFMLGTRKISRGDCFHIWQASREAVAVELPSVEENGTLTRGVVIGVLGVVRSNIEAQGLKVAP